MHRDDRVLVVGTGYAGARLVKLLKRAGVATYATSRTARVVEGVSTVALDLDADSIPELPPHTVLVYLAPPPADGAQDPRSERLVASLTRRSATTRALVYVSTTGVYGDCDGAWVDEQSPVRPGTPRAERRVAAERIWRAAAQSWAVPLAILRVAGIYGPNRLPLARLASGEPLLRADLSPYTNRIHIDDLVTALYKLAGLDATFDIADGQPLPLTTFYHTLADASGRARLPETDDRTRVPSVRGGFGESRQIRAERLRECLGTLRYPDLQSGLRASIAEQEGVDVQ
ncbi:MAG: NAD-dependent epimerase/dehydratase family protein [Pseudomonadota bacterium]